MNLSMSILNELTHNTWWPLWAMWILQGVFGFYNVWAYRKKMIQQDKDLYAVKPKSYKPVVLFVSVKGIDDIIDVFIKGIFNQDYVNYRIILTVESENDSICAVIRDYLGLQKNQYTWTPKIRVSDKIQVGDGLQEVKLNVAGLSNNCGQKIHNILHALDQLKDSDKLITFADADIQCEPDWLRKLVTPLNLQTHKVVTTYRWLIPVFPSMPNWLASVINASVATLGGPEWCNMIWGGSNAITQEAYHEIKLYDHWKGALNDDLQFSYTVKKAKLPISYIRSMMRPSSIKFDWEKFIAFGRRQYYQVRIYAPFMWSIAFVTTLFYTICFVTVWLELLSGFLPAIIPIVIMTILNQLRAHERIKICRYIFTDENLKKLEPTFKLERFATSFWFFIHLVIISITTFMKYILWAYIKYHVTGRQKTEVISRG